MAKRHTASYAVVVAWLIDLGAMKGNRLNDAKISGHKSHRLPVILRHCTDRSLRCKSWHIHHLSHFVVSCFPPDEEFKPIEVHSLLNPALYLTTDSDYITSR
jgi:hypothetical protein